MSGRPRKTTRTDSGAQTQVVVDDLDLIHLTKGAQYCSSESESDTDTSSSDEDEERSDAEILKLKEETEKFLAFWRGGEGLPQLPLAQIFEKCQWDSQLMLQWAVTYSIEGSTAAKYGAVLTEMADFFGSQRHPKTWTDHDLIIFVAYLATARVRNGKPALLAASTIRKYKTAWRKACQSAGAPVSKEMSTNVDIFINAIQRHQWENGGHSTRGVIDDVKMGQIRITL